jgi:predicted negative regulator of RcsB-dependent stress response
MTKHPASRRVHREHTDEDVFVTGVVESSVWAREHQTKLVVSVIALVLVILGTLYYRNYRHTISDKAASELNTARQSFAQGNMQLAERDLKTYVAKFGSTPSGEEARLMLAQAYLETGKALQAVEVVRPIAKDPSEGEGAEAGLILGAAYAAAKNNSEAERAYLRVADKARFGFQKRDALERAAQLKLQSGDKAGAARLYERAMNTLPKDSPDRALYEMRMAEASAVPVKS